MEGPDAEAVRHSPWLRQRLEAVRDFRSQSSAADTKKLADILWRFFRTPQPVVPYLAIPRHVTGLRDWFTVAHLGSEVIASDALFTAVDPDGFVFGVLSSAMFFAWLRTVGGAIKSDPRFSGPMVYNTFPLPVPSATARKRVITAGEQLRSARSQHPGLALEAMYQRLSVPADVLAAHGVLDRAVDALFGRSKYLTLEDRLQALFQRYEEDLGRLERADPLPRHKPGRRPPRQ